MIKMCILSNIKPEKNSNKLAYQTLYNSDEKIRRCRITMAQKRSCIECYRPLKKKERTCGTCRNRKYRRNNKERYAFENLRSSARKRKIEFTLTFDEFSEFIKGTEYMDKKHRLYKTSLTIDRIKEGEGYKTGNLQILTREQNTKKYQASLKITTEEYPF